MQNLVDAFDFRRLIRCRQCIDEVVQVPVIDIVDAVTGVIDTVIRDTALGVVIGANPLGTIAGADLGFLFFADGIFLLLKLHIVKLCL